MAMELNRKKLHVHALPVVMVVTALLIVGVVVAVRSQASVTTGVQALFGQVPKPDYQSSGTNQIYSDSLGQTASNYMDQQ